ncbi:MAG: RidA family protein [Dehalococcoidia bacterium]|nr:RidA family protein [Dehalococcoidia bacterium]
MTERRRISSGGPWEERVGYSRAVVVGDRAWVAGTTGTRPDGTVPATVEEQTALALEVIARALGEAGGSVTDIVTARVYITRVEEWEAVTSALRAVLGETRPALTLVQVAGLLLPAHRVEIEVEAVLGLRP